MIRLPYDDGHIDFDDADENVISVLDSSLGGFKPAAGGAELVGAALDNPIGSERLEELIRGKKNMVIITSDHTRPVPSRITRPIILRRIRGANPEIKIKIVIAAGTHRGTTRGELIEKFGEKIVSDENIIVHDAAKSETVSLGRLGTGLHVEVNREIMETDFLMAEGFIEPHFFAGFSGGRKSVFPGVASLRCVKANHCAEYIASPFARTGVLADNPVHIEALETARRAKLKFILNVVIDGDKKIVNAFAGQFDKAHAAGCDFVKKYASVAPAPADIVITSNGGYPMDRNIYQAVKCMTAAEASCGEGGVIIAAAGCRDGHGGGGFYETFKNAPSPRDVTEKIIKRSRAETENDQWQSQILARVLEKHTVVLVSDMIDKKTVEDMFMIHKTNIADAVAEAKKILRAAGRQNADKAPITVIPDGVAVIVG